MKFDAIERRRQKREIAHGLQHIFARLAGEPKDDVYDDFEALVLQPPVGVLKHFKFVAAVDAPRSLFMDGLQAQFDPDGLVVKRPFLLTRKKNGKKPNN